MPDLETIDIEIFESIRRLFSLTKQLPPISSYFILLYLESAAQISQQELAKAMKVKPQSISEQLKRLEADGMVIRSASPADKRVSLVRITDLGQKMLHERYNDLETYTAAFLSGFCEDEKIQLNRFLSSMIQKHSGQESGNSGRKPAVNKRSMVCSCRNGRCEITENPDGSVQGYSCEVGRQLAESSYQASRSLP